MFREMNEATWQWWFEWSSGAACSCFGIVLFCCQNEVSERGIETAERWIQCFVNSNRHHQTNQSKERNLIRISLVNLYCVVVSFCQCRSLFLSLSLCVNEWMRAYAYACACAFLCIDRPKMHFGSHTIC